VCFEWNEEVGNSEFGNGVTLKEAHSGKFLANLNPSAMENCHVLRAALAGIQVIAVPPIPGSLDFQASLYMNYQKNSAV
jgi:hypothetical protein